MPFIASGSYGCIYKPHLPCSNGLKVGKNTVGKIFGETEDYIKEKTINDLVKRWDPTNKFTLPLLGHCKTKLNEKNASMCEHANDIEQKYQQLIHKYGGKDLMQLMKMKKKSGKSLDFMISGVLPIVEGLLTINKDKYAHLDIKPDNILFDGSKMYLIDFGLVSKYNTIYSNKNKFILSHNYPFYPPEFKAYIFKSYNDFYTAFNANFAFRLTIRGKKLDLLEYLQNVLMYTDEEQRSDLRALYANRKKYNNKIDVYAFGIVLLLLYTWCDSNDKDIASIIKQCLRFDPNKRIGLSQLHNKLELFIGLKHV